MNMLLGLFKGWKLLLLVSAVAFISGYKVTSWYYDAQVVEAWKLTVKNQREDVRERDDKLAWRKKEGDRMSAEARAWERKYKEELANDEYMQEWDGADLPSAVAERMHNLPTYESE